MPRQIIIPKGTRFGHWTVVGHAGVNRHRMTMLACRCDCGRTATLISANLRTGKSTRCQACACSSNHAFRPVKLNPEKVAQIKQALIEGVSRKELAIRFQVSKPCIDDVATGRCWVQVPWPDGHQRAPRRKRLSAKGQMTADQVREVRARLAQGQSQARIARELQVGPNAVWHVAKGNTWKGVI